MKNQDSALQMRHSKDTSIADRLIQVNQRLKIAQLGVQIEQRGQKLGLRGTFPPRPGSSRLKPYQQRISLNLPSTIAGLKQAEQQAKIVAAQLLQHTFSWRDYLSVLDGKPLHQMDLPEKLQAFRNHLNSQSHSHPAAIKTTWNTAYAPYFRKLEAIAAEKPYLTLPEAIYATVLSTPNNSRSRQICCTALGGLADFLNLELPQDLKDFWGSYSPSHTRMRHLPSDRDIVEAIQKIPNPAWRFVYGIMSTYGLRNHEVFFCDYQALQAGDPEAAIEVLDTTKTGRHEVWPFYPEWVEQFQLRDVVLPKLNVDLTQTTLQRVGQQVSSQFKRYDIPFAPYNLRHAWAVRTIHFGLPDTVAAQMMGHSVAIHTRTYHRWITRRDQQRAVKAALSRNPLSPPE